MKNENNNKKRSSDDYVTEIRSARRRLVRGPVGPGRSYFVGRAADGMIYGVDRVTILFRVYFI